MARRAASICRLLIPAGSWGINPYSPQGDVKPPLASPDMRPRWTLRCLTRRGISIRLRSRRHLGLVRRVPLGDDVAAVDPDLDADAAVRRVRVDLAVADVGAQRAERDAAVLVPLAAAHLGAAEASRNGDLHALGARLHG